MDDPLLTEILAASPLFAGLDAGARQACAEQGRGREVRAEAYFYFQDVPAVRLYLLVSGRVRFTQVGAAGRQVLLRVAGPGEAFGAVAVLGDAVYPATAQAVGACRAWGWTGAAFAALLEQYPRLALNTLRFLAGRLREYQDRTRELATEQAAQRIAHTLVRLTAGWGRAAPGGLLLDLPLTRQDVAELSGTTLFTASRLLREWERQGLLTSGRARVLIRDLAALHALADAPPAAE